MRKDEKLKFQGGYLEGILDLVKDTDIKRAEMIKNGMSADVYNFTDEEIKKMMKKSAKRRLDW